MINCVEVKNIKELSNLASEIWHEYWVCILSIEQINYMVEKFQSKKAIKNQIKNENYTYFFIKQNDKNIGYIGLSKKEDYLFLSKFYVQKDFRNKGIGTQVFEFIKEFTQQNHYKKIQLTVNKNNTNTINAYKKWGFEIVNSVVSPIGNGFVMDDYIMEYIL